MGRARHRRKGTAGNSAPAAPAPTTAAQRSGVSEADMDARLDELYARVPGMLDCKGLCYDSCTRIALSPREQERIREQAGVTVPSAGFLDVLQPYSGQRCPALTPVGRCSVYEIRPMICRLFGAARDSGCEHGCTPIRWLHPVEARELLAEAFAAGGDQDRAELERRLAERLRAPEFLARYMQSAAESGTLIHGAGGP